MIRGVNSVFLCFADIFKFDADFEATEEKYKELKRDILGSGSSDSGASGRSGSEESSEDSEEEKGK